MNAIKYLRQLNIKNIPLRYALVLFVYLLARQIQPEPAAIGAASLGREFWRKGKMYELRFSIKPIFDNLYFLIHLCCKKL